MQVLEVAPSFCPVKILNNPPTIRVKPSVRTECDCRTALFLRAISMLLTGNDEKHGNYYDEIYARGYNTAGYYPLYQGILATLDSLESPRVLEIGCGVGDLGKLISDRGYAYRGFDFSEEAVRCSRELCPEANFRQGDAYDKTNYEPHDYNVAIALEVLEHVDDFKVIENVPPGVRFIGSVPDYNDVAHLRIYQDPQRDIIERFKPYLSILDVKALESKNINTGKKQTIYVFYGIRKAAPIMAAQGLSARPGRNDVCPCGSGRKYKKCCGD